MTAERKYTDRDVRENESLKDLAIEYVLGYGGDFEPLVNAVAILKDKGDLPTNIVRVVLNCMRHDHNVADKMPDPVHRAEVIQMPKKKRRRNWQESCSETKSHEGHQWKDGDDYLWCEGVPFPIDRPLTVGMDATIKLPYLKARGGKLVHITAGEAVLYFWPNRHEWGFKDRKAELHAKTLCKYPSWIKEPELLNVDQAEWLVSPYVPTLYQMCPHCEKVKSGDAN